MTGPGPGQGILELIIFDPRRGESKEVPLRFVELHGQPHVLFPARTPPDWVSLATRTSLAWWRIEGRVRFGTARLVENPVELTTEIIPSYVAQFGLERLAVWFGSEPGCLALVESLAGKPYYHEVEAIFDKAAPDYDRAIQADRLNMHLRTVAGKVLRRLFPPGSRVLEIGCGTGVETIPLAESGVDLVAVDISSRMLEELDRKASARSVHDRIETRKGSAGDMGGIVSEFGPGSFDGAFSHFGALNCEPQLGRVPPVLHQLVKPGGRISLGILNRTCLSEIVLFGLAMRPSRSLARLQSPIPVGQSRFGVSVFPYGPGEVKRLFRPYFSPEEAIGVSVFLPPSHLGRRFRLHPELLGFLEALDGTFAKRPLLRYLGDYFLMQMRRR